MMSAQRIFSSLFSDLNSRQKEVISARFAIDAGKDPLTLAALGKRYGVTRERIRQIEASALDIIRKKIKATPANDILNASQKYLKTMGGVARQEDLLSFHRTSVEGLRANHLSLLLEATKAFYEYPEDASFVSFYYLDKESLKRAMDFLSQFTKSAHAKKGEILSGQFNAHLASFVRQKRMDSKLADNYLRISKRILKSPYGDIGLAEWPEINPRTIRDRIYLVLKKKGKPIHFEDIAKSINEAGFSGRKALAPTVHNELIKDSRFVLVGRGIYALAEHGYEAGTAKEVIHRILKKQGPMTYRQLVGEVQKDRFFKPNTILANLQNKVFFERTENGAYRIRQD